MTYTLYTLQETSRGGTRRKSRNSGTKESGTPEEGALKRWTLRGDGVEEDESGH